MPSSAVVAHVATPLLGVSTGLRSFTPLAVVAWFARSGKLPVENTWASWIAHPAAVGVLTAAALGESIADKLPNTPNRTAALPLIGRLALGGTVGAIVATAFRRPIAGGIAMGVVGAAAGTYGGFYLRKGLTKGAGLADLPVAITGDSAAVALAVRSLRRLTA
ncbi:MAG: DUF4126 family protein [Janthinobacterium lividum]